ncbi:tetratricopeptide repeat protein [bacterium]|nr:tetratricopeptide repeat protein [bacterium]
MKFHKIFLLLLSLSLVATPRIATAQPSEIEILFQQGSAAQEAGNYAEAEAIWRKLLQIEPDEVAAEVAAWNNLGLALAEQGKWDEAVTSYRRAIELDPNFAPAHSNLGNILRQQGKLEEAASHYRRAIEIEPTASRYGYLGEVLSELGDIEERSPTISVLLNLIRTCLTSTTIG